MIESRVPYDRESKFSMSNLDGHIDEALEQDLRTQPVYGKHYAWNFCGEVWYGEDGRFHEEVWVYKALVEIVSADSLRELMDAVNDKYGSA